MADSNGGSDTIVEAIALSSPGGRMSRAARRRAERRLELELFGSGGFAAAVKPKPAVHTNAEKAKFLRLRAKDLWRLADGGIRPRVHRREAARLELEADRFDEEKE